MNFLINLVQRFGAFFHRWPGFVRICHGLVGADRRILARASKPEQAAHTAMGTLMLLAALWTGVTMSTKVSTLVGDDPGFVLRALLFGFFAALSLAMEVAVISTLKSGQKNLVAVRLALSLTLVCLQVLPLGVMAFQDRIDFELHQKTLTNVATALGLSAKARGVESLQVKAGELQAKADAARRTLQNPGPAPQAVIDAEAGVSLTQAKVAQANKALEDARRRVAQWRAKLASVQLTDQERSRLELTLKAATERLVARQNDVNTSDAAAENARTELSTAQRSWRAGLESSVKDADEAARQHDLVLSQAASQQSVDVARAEQLAGKANKSSFFSSLGMLLQLALHDIAVSLTLAFCFLVAALIDLLPLATKLALLNGVHARGTATREAVETERLDLYRDQAHLMADAQRLQAQQEHDALAKWVAADQGATQAQEHALAAQQTLDRTRLNASADLIGAHAEATRTALTKLQEVQTLAEANPALGSVWRSQLAQLIEALERSGWPQGAAGKVTS